MQYLEDQEKKTFTTRVASVVDGKYVTLEKTYFYPRGGGQPSDEGTLKRRSDGKEFRVVYAKKHDGTVSHEVDEPGLVEGDEVEAVIDWNRREKLMRSHTAAHVVSALIHQETGAKITGNQLSLEKVRIDFSVDEYNPALFTSIIARANEYITKGAPVRFETITREAALAEPSLAKLAVGLPEKATEIRVVEVEGLDRQACAGTHVDSLSRIGRLTFVKAENKGKSNRRVYFLVEE